jgi:3-deoxy-D-manno-octulosonate 8-phosphate phosphatase (KDO 8-P phosphatase)
MPLPNIKLLLLDVDGVLTDGSIILDSTGGETKRFHVRDGMAIVMWQRLGLRVGLLSGRPSVVTTLRAAELKIDLVSQGKASEKLKDFEDLCRRAKVTAEEVAYMGDDLADLPVLLRVGFSMTPSDGVEEVRSAVKLVTQARAGRGAVREAVEHLLKGMNRWDEVLEEYGL